MRAVLAQPWSYTLLQRGLGAGRLHNICVREYIRAQTGDALLDLGCGPADLLNYLGDVCYTGIDISSAYIDKARAAYGTRARFVCGPAAPETLPARQAFDIVLASEVLHHLDDIQAETLFETARLALKPGARLVSWDPCWCIGQARIARWLNACDRGAFVRTASEYARLARHTFDNVRVAVRHDVLWIPYTMAFMECTVNI